jgi:quercetin dioxygenase-like cupin family protein
VKAHDLRAALARTTLGKVTTAEEDAAAFPRLEAFNDGAVYVGRFSGETPWERHPGADELLYVLDGETELTLLAAGGPVQVCVGAGSAFVVPRGLWHRQLAPRGVTLLAATPDDSEVSDAADPRSEEIPWRRP